VAVATAGRAAGAVTVSTGVWAFRVDGADLEQADVRARRLQPSDSQWPLPLGEQRVTGTPERIAEVLARYEAGAEHLILNPSPTPFSLFDASYPERLALVLGRLR
jgi:hypothetical protein